MGFVFEFVLEIYCELMLNIVPKEKATTKKYKTIAVLIAVVGLISVFVLVIWGGLLISDYDNNLGIIPIAIAVIISVAQIIAGIVLRNKKSKNKE